VVGPRGVVAQHLRAKGPDEQPPEVLQLPHHTGFIFFNKQLQVLGGPLVGHLNSLIFGCTDEHSPVVLYRRSRDLRGREHAQLLLQLLLDRHHKSVARGLVPECDQDRSSLHVVLRLCQQVSRYQARVLLGVGENKQLGGSRQHVNLHQPAHELLGGGHVLVAWPHNHIHSRHRPSPVRQRRDRLSATNGQHMVSPSNVGGTQHQRRRMRRGHPDLLASCNLRRDNCHQDC